MALAEKKKGPQAATWRPRTKRNPVQRSFYNVSNMDGQSPQDGPRPRADSQTGGPRASRERARRRRPNVAKPKHDREALRTHTAMRPKEPESTRSSQVHHNSRPRRETTPRDDPRRETNHGHVVQTNRPTIRPPRKDQHNHQKHNGGANLVQGGGANLVQGEGRTWFRGRGEPGSPRTY